MTRKEANVIMRSEFGALWYEIPGIKEKRNALMRGESKAKKRKNKRKTLKSGWKTTKRELRGEYEETGETGKWFVLRPDGKKRLTQRTSKKRFKGGWIVELTNPYQSSDDSVLLGSDHWRMLVLSEDTDAYTIISIFAKTLKAAQRGAEKKIILDFGD